MYVLTAISNFHNFFFNFLFSSILLLLHFFMKLPRLNSFISNSVPRCSSSSSFQIYFNTLFYFHIQNIILCLLSTFFSFYTVRYRAVTYRKIQYSTVQYSTVKYSTVQYSTVCRIISKIHYCSTIVIS